MNENIVQEVAEVAPEAVQEAAKAGIGKGGILAIGIAGGAAFTIAVQKVLKVLKERKNARYATMEIDQAETDTEEESEN